MGGAKVSEKHANVVVNADGATADDIIKLTDVVATKVRDTYGVQLECEIKIVK